MIHDTWRRFVEGVDFGPEWNARAHSTRTRSTTSARSCRSAWRARRTRARTRRSRRRSSHGGTKTNVIPDRVEIEVDIRTLPGQRGADVREDARRRARRPRRATSRSRRSTRTSRRVADRHADVGRDGARVVARWSTDSALVPFLTVGATDARFFRRAGSVAYGFGLFSRTLSFEDYAVDVPRQRRARRRRVARALHPALGRPRPRPPELTRSGAQSSPLVAEVALEVFGEGCRRTGGRPRRTSRRRPRRRRRPSSSSEAGRVGFVVARFEPFDVACSRRRRRATTSATERSHAARRDVEVGEIEVRGRAADASLSRSARVAFGFGGVAT